MVGHLPDHPDIAMALETGYPAPVRWPVCPVCGAQCDTIYVSRDTGERLGCGFCCDEPDDEVEEVNAWQDEEAMRDEWF